MKFRLNIDPPTATAQEKKVTVRNGRALVYKSTNAKMAEQILRMALAPHRPKEPMDGPLQLIVWWVFQRPKCCKKAALWKTTRPDTDNLNKGLKDIMTSLKYWHDDAQVCKETILKCYGDNPGIEINIESLMVKKHLRSSNPELTEAAVNMIRLNRLIKEKRNEK